MTATMPDVVEQDVTDLDKYFDIDMRRMMITPQIASDFLATMSKTRKMSRPRVRRLMTEFSEGRYILTPHSLAFNEQNQMVDGQHRCAAIVLAEVTVPMFVALGVSREAELVMDTGRPRTFPDVLGIRDVSDPRMIGALCSLLYQYETGVVEDNTKWTQKVAPSFPLLMAEYDDKATALAEANTAGRKAHQVCKINRTVLSTGYMILTAVDREKAREFYDQLEMQSETISAPVRKLIATAGRLQERRTVSRLPWQWDQRVQLALLLKTWNMWLEGRDPEILRFTKAENFPEPQTPQSMLVMP